MDQNDWVKKVKEQTILKKKPELIIFKKNNNNQKYELKIRFKRKSYETFSFSVFTS